MSIITGDIGEDCEYNGRPVNDKPTADLVAALEGRRIVSVEEEPADHPVPDTRCDRWQFGKDWRPEIVLNLDNGTRIYLGGNEGCGGCSAGWYELAQHVAQVDNIITAVHIVCHPTDEDSPDYDTGYYAVHVVAESTDINVAQFDGDDGNGYYGSGFQFLISSVETKEDVDE